MSRIRSCGNNKIVLALVASLKAHSITTDA